MKSRLAVGGDFEQTALELLLATKRARLIEKNFCGKTGEIDLIIEETLEDGVVELVFIEVRSKKSGALVQALESVNRKKQIRIIRTAEIFLSRYRGPATGLRFDVVAFDGKQCVHCKNAFSL
ncbi:MAG: hypothetical protein A3K03_01730 [Bdellovibrionales bacterium RIFOXYD1_FULL_44_7]|nr:MAG: hypothetical protein A3K03_01730 [Bdellovibrionales bacterium RIFOXYD1_FULL_44_7]